MGNPLSDNTVSEINKAAVLDWYAYDDDQLEEYESKENIIDVLDCSKKHGRALGENEALREAIEKNGLSDFKLIKQSSTTVRSVDASGNYKMNEVIAYAFRDEKTGDIYIIYRGTGDGKWVDNGEGLVKAETVMQRRAAEFYDDVIRAEGLDKENPDNRRVIVSGHSKGGNLAQFVTMASEYAELVDVCYSIDGQGFSKEAIKSFKKRWGEDYQKIVDKMYSINGKNDYVHDLGHVIINENQTYFIDTKGSGFGAWHLIDCFFEDGRFLWDENENPEIRFNIPQGSVGLFVKEVSANMMMLNDEEIEDCAITVMWLLELFMKSETAEGKDVNSLIGTGNRKSATIEEMAGFLKVGVPMLINIFGKSEHAKGFIEELGLGRYGIIIDEIQKFVNEKNIDLGQYILEDPMRLITIYSSFDLSKKKVHELVAILCSVNGLAKFVATAFLPVPIVALADIVGGLVTAAATIGIIANHILLNWDKFVENVKASLEYIGDQINKAVDFAVGKAIEGYEYVTDKIDQAADYIYNKVTELYTSIRNTVRKELNETVGKIYGVAESIITKSTRFFDKACELLSKAQKVSIAVMDKVLKYTNPLFYSIASSVYRARQSIISINIKKLKECVNTLYRLATRISALDTRLDNLYYKLSRNNIEQEEGVFTSLASIYNLFSADLNIDQGGVIRRKARALSELVEKFEATERKIINGVPHVG
ncbi:MAG: DUF2974 domain-containing protein [Clostridia bacterium]|nr:DUF2974 domain-containing protein [Clostridia bacterium]